VEKIMTQLKYLPWLIGMLLTAACSQPAIKPSSVASTPEKEVAPIAVDENYPKQNLTPEILYQFLLAEIAGQRGEIGLAKSAYLDLARKTKDPRIAQRATEIAVFARDQKGALEATRLWNDADHNSAPANLTLVTLLLAQDKFAEAEPLLKKTLVTDAPMGFLHMSAWLGKTRDPAGALALVQRMAADYPMLPEAQFAIAQAALLAGKPEAVLAALQQADKLRPGWEPAALLRAQCLVQGTVD